MFSNFSAYTCAQQQRQNKRQGQRVSGVRNIS
jgi:hypothetical protein